MLIKRLTVILLFVGIGLSAAAQQVDWKRFVRMIDNGEYKSAFNQCVPLPNPSSDRKDKTEHSLRISRARACEVP